MIETALKMGIAPRAEISHPDECDRYLDMGVKHFCIGTDVSILFNWFRDCGKAMNQLLKRDPPSSGPERQIRLQVVRHRPAEPYRHAKSCRQAEHRLVTRRYFLQLAGGEPRCGLPDCLRPRGRLREDALAEAIAKLEYLTLPEDFGTVERGNPLPYTHPGGEAARGRHDARDLEAGSDLRSRSARQIEAPALQGSRHRLDLGRPDEARRKARRAVPQGHDLQQRQQLRWAWVCGKACRCANVVWLAKPVENVRRVFYYGYHNDDPKQLFQSSLPIGRVLEDPPGEHPVILCYKLNGELLSGKRGGPVRMLVPEAYGFKSVKWLQRSC